MAGSRSDLRPLTFGRIALLAAAVVLAGCPKSDESKKGGPSPSASALPGAPPDAADASVEGGATAAKPADGPATFSGSYSVTPGTYYIPPTKDYASVKPAKDDGTKHVGDGTLTLTVDGDGKITGTVDTGPAGPGVVEGSVIDGELRGFIRRRDPKDEGLTGTFTAKQSGDAVEGKLSLAEASAAVVREGKFSLAKKK